MHKHTFLIVYRDQKTFKWIRKYIRYKTFNNAHEVRVYTGPYKFVRFKVDDNWNKMWSKVVIFVKRRFAPQNMPVSIKTTYGWHEK